MVSIRIRLVAFVLGVLASGGQIPSVNAAEDSKDEQAQLLKALSTAKHTLIAGIEQAAAKAPEAAISAKFEVEDGKFSLSVYTAEKGLTVAAEHNVLKELGGRPDVAKWTPEAEVFKDVEHVSRASEQLTLMALTKLSLIDIVKKAAKDQPGTVFSVIPVMADRKPQFVVLVAGKDKITELRYNLLTGQTLAPPRR